MRKFVSRGAQGTRRWAALILRTLSAEPRRPLVLALAGELGSGKTAFVQGLAQALGIREKVQSPTFVLMRRYRLGRRARPFRAFIHIDAYRFGRLAEAERLGLGAIFRDRDAIVVIEWADRIRRLVPRSAVWITFKHKAKNRRMISIHALPSKAKRRRTNARRTTTFDL